MGTKLCVRFGLLEGAAVGLLLNLLKTPPCCNPVNPAPLTIAQTVLYSLLVAFVMGFALGGLTYIVSRLPLTAVLQLSLLIALAVGLFLGPLAYSLPHPILGMWICAFLGGFLGWLVCRILCGSQGMSTEFPGRFNAEVKR